MIYTVSKNNARGDNPPSRSRGGRIGCYHVQLGYSRRTPSCPARSSNRLTLQSFCRLAEQLHAFLMLQAPVQAATEVTNTPARKRQYDHAELSPSTCQLVSRSGRMVGVKLSMYQAVGLESLEATRQHVGSDPGQTLLKILESHAPGKQVSDDEQCPPRTNDLKRSGNGARLAEVCFYHSRASSFGSPSYSQVNSFYICQYRRAKKGHSVPRYVSVREAAAVRTVRSPRHRKIVARCRSRLLIR
jgi:hypothetical protein